MDQNFIDAFIERCPARARILDLGAGHGRYSKLLAGRGHAVTAVSPDCDDPHLENVRWTRADVTAWIAALEPDARFDAVFMRHSLQTLAPAYAQDVLAPALLRHLQPGGVIAIETFFADSKPASSVPFASYWSAKKLHRLFAGLEVLRSEQYEQDRETRGGGEKLFRLADIIVKKPAARQDQPSRFAGFTRPSAAASGSVSLMQYLPR
ncbi:MAG: hypothetical protein RLZZ324_856 [Candidatus Parcubacteria bacterium]|jgi:SAM-dependent methyltransferase